MTHEWTKGPTKWTEGTTLFVSVPFTWNLPKVMREAAYGDAAGSGSDSTTKGA